MHLTKRHRVWGMEDFRVLWVWGFCGNSHRLFCGYGMAVGIELQSPRQHCFHHHRQQYQQVWRLPWSRCMWPVDCRPQHTAVPTSFLWPRHQLAVSESAPARLKYTLYRLHCSDRSYNMQGVKWRHIIDGQDAIAILWVQHGIVCEVKRWRVISYYVIRI